MFLGFFGISGVFFGDFCANFLGISGEYFWDFLGIFGEFLGNFLRIHSGFYGNSLQIFEVFGEEFSNIFSTFFPKIPSIPKKFHGNFPEFCHPHPQKIPGKTKKIWEFSRGHHGDEENVVLDSDPDAQGGNRGRNFRNFGGIPGKFRNFRRVRDIPRKFRNIPRKFWNILRKFPLFLVLIPKIPQILGFSSRTLGIPAGGNFGIAEFPEFPEIPPSFFPGRSQIVLEPILLLQELLLRNQGGLGIFRRKFGNF